MPALSPAVADILRCIRTPERYDLDVIAASMMATHRVAAKKLRSILEPLLEAGADGSLMTNLITVCMETAQSQLLAEMLRAIADQESRASEPSDVAHPRRSVH